MHPRQPIRSHKWHVPMVGLRSQNAHERCCRIPVLARRPFVDFEEGPRPLPRSLASKHCIPLASKHSNQLPAEFTLTSSAGVDAQKPAERPKRAAATGAAAASAPSWRADEDRRAANEWAPSPRARPASCAAFAAAASCATKPSRTASETQHSGCSMRGGHATNETMTILAPTASSTDQEASLLSWSQEHATIFICMHELFFLHFSGGPKQRQQQQQQQ